MIHFGIFYFSYYEIKKRVNIYYFTIKFFLLYLVLKYKYLVLKFYYFIG
jgi:hypothetical protein